MCLMDKIIIHVSYSYNATIASEISFLLQESEAQPRTSLNNWLESWLLSWYHSSLKVYI